MPLTPAILADLNHGGYPDLVATGGHGNAAGASTIGVYHGQDLIVLRSTPDLEILLGDGDGTFQTASPIVLPLSSVAYDLLVADFNGDGIPDLAVANRDANSVTVLIGAVGGAFAISASQHSISSWAMGTGPLPPPRPSPPAG